MTLHELQFSPWQCSRARHQRSTCTLCADICPTGAISRAAPLHVAADRCTGCGACAAVCPSGAFVTEPAVKAWKEPAAASQPQPTLTLACGRDATPTSDEDAVQVPCVGRIDEALLLEAVTTGPYMAVVIRADACSSCPSQTARATVEQTVRQAQALLAAFGHGGRIILAAGAPTQPAGAPAPTLPSAPGSLSRRRLFAALLGGLAAPLGPAAATPGGGYVQIDGAEEPPKGQLPVRLPARRRRLLDALKSLADRWPTPARDAGAAKASWAQFSVTESCTGCQMCAYFCPTGALQTIEHDGRTGLAFKLADCTNCRLCLDVCFWDAVVLSEEIDLDKVLSGSVDLYWHAATENGDRNGLARPARKIVS